jgi:hypothetical protein
VVEGPELGIFCSGSGEISNFLLGHGLRWGGCGHGLGTGRVGLAERWLEGPQDKVSEVLEAPRRVLVVRLYLSTWFSGGNVIVVQPSLSFFISSICCLLFEKSNLISIHIYSILASITITMATKSPRARQTNSQGTEGHQEIPEPKLTFFRGESSRMGCIFRPFSRIDGWRKGGCGEISITRKGAYQVRILTVTRSRSRVRGEKKEAGQEDANTISYSADTCYCCEAEGETCCGVVVDDEGGRRQAQDLSVFSAGE